MAREASISVRVGISYQYKGPCNIKQYKCYKESRRYSVYCYRDDNECGNLSGLAVRTEVALVERPRRKQARANIVGNSI